jgi:hypothetical protein
MEIQEKRSMGDMLKMPRDCARSLQRTHNVRYKGDLLKGAFFVWLADYFTTVLRGKYPFPEYDLSDPRAGIHVMPNSVKIGLAGDWASGTVSAYRVRYEMEELDPDITIHLGDVYFAGKQEEFDEYFMGADDWPRGSLQRSDEITALPSYALNGNHEMYSGASWEMTHATCSGFGDTSTDWLPTESIRRIQMGRGHARDASDMAACLLKTLTLR